MTGLRHHEPADGSGRARSRCSQRTSYHCGRAPRRRQPSRAPMLRTRAVPKCGSIFRFRRRRILTARFAKFRNLRESGATSIRSCCTDGIWVSKAISRRLWRRAIRRLWSCITTWNSVKHEAAKFMKVKAVWQFFEAERDGNSSSSSRPARRSPLHTFHFGTPAARERLCLSDYVLDPQGRPARSSGALRGDRGRGHSRTVRKKPKQRGRVLQGARRCRRWRSKPPKAARSGCIAASAKIGVFPIPPT